MADYPSDTDRPSFGDTHIHTNYSKDSSETLDDLFLHDLPEIVSNVNLKSISIADHNTIRAYTHGLADRRIEELNKILPIERRVKLVLGTELSLDVGERERKQHMHFLFYYPTRPGEITDKACELEEGVLGGVMNRIIAQNNERHMRMALIAAKNQKLSPDDTETFIEIINELKKPSQEIGREHIKVALSGLFDKRPNQLRAMFSRPCEVNDGTSCYVPLHEAKIDVPYKETLWELRCAYPKATIALAHPWRYDSEFQFSDPGKRKDGILYDMSRFIDDLINDERCRLINSLEIQGNYKIPKEIQNKSIEDLRMAKTPKELLERIRHRKEWCRYTEDKYALMAGKYNLMICAGNDSHGKSKPDIPIGYGCCSTDPAPESRLTARGTPLKTLALPYLLRR